MSTCQCIVILSVLLTVGFCQGISVPRFAYATIVYGGTPKDYEYFVAARVMVSETSFSHTLLKQ